MTERTPLELRWATPGATSDLVEDLIDRLGESAQRTVVVPGGHVRECLIRTVPVGTEVVTVDRLAIERLDAGGWVVPEPLVHAGRPVGGWGEPLELAEDWLATFLDDRPAYRRPLAVIESPRSLVATLERLIADGIVPTPDGWVGDARRRLLGDEEALEHRLATVRERVPEVDPAGVRAAFEADRGGLEAFAHDALAHYLGWCLDRATVSRAQRTAYASWLTGGEAIGYLLALTEVDPPMSHLDLVATQPTERTTIALDALPSTGGDRDWTPPHPTRRDRITDHLDGRSIADTITEADSNRRRSETVPPRSWYVQADDSVTRGLEVLEGVLADGLGDLDPPAPDEVVLVATTRADTRRLLRLGANRSVHLARAGRIAIYRTPVAILSLAWLRIVTGHDAARGWAVVLERAGCSRGDLQAWLETDDKPAAFAAFRSDLKQLDDGLALIDAVATRYGLDGRSTATLVGTLGASLRSAPTAFAVLDQLERGFAGHHLGELEPTDSDAVSVIAAPDLIDERPSMLVHLDGGRSWVHGPLAYAPPLGLRWTQRAVEVGDHLIERPDANWEALACLRTDRDALRRRIDRLRGHARDGVILVGRRPPGLDVEPLE